MADPHLEAAWRECKRRYGHEFELDDFLRRVEDYIINLCELEVSHGHFVSV